MFMSHVNEIGNLSANPSRCNFLLLLASIYLVYYIHHYGVRANVFMFYSWQYSCSIEVNTLSHLCDIVFYCCIKLITIFITLILQVLCQVFICPYYYFLQLEMVQSFSIDMSFFNIMMFISSALLV